MNTPNAQGSRPMIPGELLLAADEIELNADRALLTVEVANNGDRAVEIGSHYHFFEVNPALEFNREATRGYRLAIPAGTTLRLEPGQRRTVDLLPYAGDRQVFGFRGEVMGSLDPSPEPDAEPSA